MWDWLLSLFDTEGFPPRWECGTWSSALGWLHVLSDLTTFVAYTAIPCVLAALILRRRDMPFPRVFWLFAAFIFACGSVHLVEAIGFWQPVYRLSGVLKLTTAVLSVATVIALVPTIRSAVTLPGFQSVTARLAAIVSTSPDAVISKDVDGTVESWNAGAERMYGWTAAEMVGQPITKIVPPELRQSLSELTARVRRGEAIEAFETERITKSGERIPISLSLAPIKAPGGATVGISAIGRDISEQKRSEEELKKTAARRARANRRLRELADRDPLTGLLNRRGFELALSVEVERMRRTGSRAAVILIDCDDFKQVNDRFGHDGGDDVLREIAERIEDAARVSDRLARIGGDEFMVLATETRMHEAMLVADRIRRAVADASIETSSGSASVSVSCGVDAVDVGRASLDFLMGRSSRSLKTSKLAGKNTVTAGRARDEVPAPDATVIRALAQSIVAVDDDSIVGFEMLIRGPTGPLESPDHLFRAHRERNSLVEMDRWCLRRCIEAAARVPDQLRVHVNVFPATLIADGAQHVIQILSQAKGPRRVCLELNESMLIGDPALLVPHAATVRKETGCRLAVDDVGFGRSSLEALILLEPDVIKIDRQFIAGISEDPIARRRLGRLVQVARALDADIIAEGVEQEGDRAVLKDLGVALAQGYLWGRPAALN